MRPPSTSRALQAAVVEGAQIELGYAAPNKEPSKRVVHPLGLATKGPIWYLVGDTEAGLRTFRVERVTAVEPTGEPVVRPDGFDLEEAWKLITERVDTMWARGIEARAAAAADSIQGAAHGLRSAPANRTDARRRSRRHRSCRGERAQPRGAAGRVRIRTSRSSNRGEVRARLAQLAMQLTATYVDC